MNIRFDRVIRRVSLVGASTHYKNSPWSKNTVFVKGTFLNIFYEPIIICLLRYFAGFVTFHLFVLNER